MSVTQKKTSKRKALLYWIVAFFVVLLILLFPKHYSLLDGCTSGFESMFFGSAFYDIRIINGRTDEYGFNSEEYICKGCVIYLFNNQVINSVNGEYNVLKHNNSNDSLDEI